MKILITNTVTLNGGDAAILRGEISLFRAAFGNTCRFIVYDSQPEVAARYHPDLEFRKLLFFSVHRPRKSKVIGRFIHYVNKVRFCIGACFVKYKLDLLARVFLRPRELQDLLEYRDADLIVSTGGTYLVEHYNIEPRILDYEIALYFKRPLVFFSQSLGPFSIPSNRRRLRKVFEKSILVLLRDEKSLQHLLDLGLKNINAFITPDAAYALVDPLPKREIDTRGNFRPTLKVAISVREWRHFATLNATVGRQRYLEAMRTVTSDLVEKYHAKITYISTCQGIEEYWTDDSKLASEVVEVLPDHIRSCVVVDNAFHSTSELLEKLRQFDLVIATRMHMAILAMAIGVPVLPIAYEFKTQQLFYRLGLGHWVQDIEKVSGESLKNVVNAFIAQLPRIRVNICAGVKKEQEELVRSIGLVKAALERWSDSSANILRK